jgi:hypothetical protein
MRLENCAHCSKQILIHGTNIISCKCRKLFFCSQPCYNSVIRTHKKVCTYHTSIQAQIPFCSPFSPSNPPEVDSAATSHAKSSQITGLLPRSQIPGPLQSSQIPGPFPSSQIPGAHPANQIPINLQTPQVPGTFPNSQILGSGPLIPSTLTNSQIPVPLPNSNIPENLSNSQIHGSLSNPELSDQRKRDGFGRFKPRQKIPKEPLSEEQKRNNLISSAVSKCKDAIVTNCSKIQVLRFVDIHIFYVNFLNPVIILYMVQITALLWQMTALLKQISALLMQIKKIFFQA